MDSRAELDELLAEKQRRSELNSLLEEKQRRQASAQSGLRDQSSSGLLPESMTPTGAARNVAAGAIEGNVNLANSAVNVLDRAKPGSKSIIDLLKPAATQALGIPKSIQETLKDPYKSFGVEESPWYTPSGIEQAAGKYLSGGALGAKLAQKLIPKLAGGIAGTGAAGAASELNEANPTISGSIEKAIAGMLTHGAISAAKPVAAKLGSMAKNAYEKLPGVQADKLQSQLDEDLFKSRQQTAKDLREIRSSQYDDVHQFKKESSSLVKDTKQQGLSQAEKIESQGINQAAQLESQALQNVHKANESADQLAKSIADNLGKGSKSIGENAAKISDELRNRHDQHSANAGAYFEHVLDQVDNAPGGGLLYEKPNPLVSMAMDKGKAMIAKVKDLSVGEAFDVFKSKPTFRNAHNLVQQMGMMIGDLKSIPHKTANERLELNNIVSAWKSLKDDMGDYLENRYPDKNVNLKPIWDKGVELYRENVEPYVSNEKIRQVTRGRQSYVPDIHKAFEYPGMHEKISVDGVRTPGFAQKILNDISADTKDRILFNKLGAPTNPSHTDLFKSIDRIAREGYSDLVAPELRDGINRVLTEKSNAEKQMAQAKISSKEIIKNAKSKAKYSLQDSRDRAEELAQAIKDKMHEKRKEARSKVSSVSDDAKVNRREMQKKAIEKIEPLRSKQRIINKVGAGVIGTSIAFPVAKHYLEG